MTLDQALTELQKLNGQDPGYWPRWAHIGAAAILAVMIVAAGAWFMMKPRKEELESLRHTEQELRMQFQAKQSKVASVEAYKAQLEEMERSFGAMLKQLPSRSEVANLLNDISQTRVASSLEEELFQPLPPVPKEFYAELPNRIVLIGGYNEMGAFVSGVAALPRIVTIDDVEIKPADADPKSNSRSDSGGNGLRMTAVLKTYRYLDEQDEAAAQTAPGTKP